MDRSSIIIASALGGYAKKNNRPIDFHRPGGGVKSFEELTASHALKRREQLALGMLLDALLPATAQNAIRFLDLERLDSGKGISELYEEIVQYDAKIVFNAQEQRVDRLANNVEIYPCWDDRSFCQILRRYAGGEEDAIVKPWGFSETRKPSERIIDTVWRCLREEPKIEPSHFRLHLELLKERPQRVPHESKAYPGIRSVMLTRVVRWRLPAFWWSAGLSVPDNGIISEHAWRPRVQMSDGPWIPMPTRAPTPSKGRSRTRGRSGARHSLRLFEQSESEHRFRSARFDASHSETKKRSFLRFARFAASISRILSRTAMYLG